MENREAIEWLKGCVVAYEVDNKGKPNGNVTCELIQEVIDMAISALEKQEQDNNKSCVTCKYKYLSVSEFPCNACFGTDFEDYYYKPYTEEES